MATTSLWRVEANPGRVKANLGKVVKYAENPEKTTNPNFTKRQDMVSGQEQWLSEVIGYAVESRKTECHDESKGILKQFVTGINCLPEAARDEMMQVKAKYGKYDGTIAYHGYQSFAPGEATPEIAHEIGVKLADKLWGDKLQVVVATHLDKGNHLHTHFVLNTVSFVDGIKFYRSNKDYYNMQKESDALCREYGLSVIENPKRGKSKQYAEWRAEKQGKPTYRNMIKADVDAAIRESMTERQFFDNLRKKGYEIKQGQDITIRYIGRDRGLKLMRNFGDDYSIERIRERILAQDKPERYIIPANPPPKQMRFKGDKISKVKMTGLKALYFYYLYRLGALPKKREPNPNRVYFLFREDIRHIQNISRETQLLVKHNIETDVQLVAYKEVVTRQINEAYEERRQLRNQARRIGNDDESIKAEISALSEKLKDLRREVRHCENIESRSDEMRKKLQQERENQSRDNQKTKDKEMAKNDLFRRRG